MSSSSIASEDFDQFAETLKESGPSKAIAQLVETLEKRGQYRALLDALLLQARHELNLPLIQQGSLTDLAEPARTKFEDRYIEALRTVGQKLIAANRIPEAWPYFRLLGEHKLIQEAIEAYQVSDDPDDDSYGPIIDIAFGQGVHPRKGYQLVLERYGICSAITAFEQLPQDPGHRAHCTELLIKSLRNQLISNLQADIERREGQTPSSTDKTTVSQLLKDRDWLFDEDNYHIDISHLSSVVRYASYIAKPEVLQLALELADYGRKLSPKHRYDGDPPFQNLYEDQSIYLRALLGEDVDQAIEHFTKKLPDPNDTEEYGYLSEYARVLPAQTLIQLLTRLNRHEQAIDVALNHLKDVPESNLQTPGVAQLCHAAGRMDRLRDIARDKGELVYYAAALLDV